MLDGINNVSNDNENHNENYDNFGKNFFAIIYCLKSIPESRSIFL